MKNRILYAVGILMSVIALFYCGCGDNGGNSDITGGGKLDALIDSLRGTNDPKAPTLYTLKVTADPTAGGTVSKSPNKTQYEKDVNVQVTATPKQGYRFTGWSGASTGTANPITVKMDGNKELIANFLQENVVTYSLTLSANPAKGGSVSKSPDKPEYAAGAAVYVTAKAESGYVFTGWSGSQTSQNATINVTMNSNKELTANFERQSYTLTVNANPTNGGSVSKSPGKSSYDYEEKVTVTASPFDGYKFTGWSGASTETKNQITVTMDGDKELTAKFEWQGTTPPPDVSITTYTLNASPNPTNGGTVSSDPYKTSYNANESVYVTAEAADGYRFTGWSGASTSASASVTVTMDGNKTLTANFEQIPAYTVSFNANGGTVSPTSGATGADGTLASLPTPTRNGYKFNGWFTDTTGGTEVTKYRKYSANTTVYAQWTLIKYRVTFNANGGTVTPAFDSTSAGGTLAYLPTPAKNGYTFSGWYTAATGGTQVTASTAFNGNTTIYAQWTEAAVNQYTITFDANGGSGTVPSLSAQIGNSVTLQSASELSRSGFTFGEWNTKSDGTGTSYGAGTTYTPTDNVTLYAKWTLNTYTITFDANGGTVTPPAGTTSEGWKLASLPTPTKNGYAFNGWYTATTGDSRITENTAFNTNTIIYAQWTLVYTITFIANGGTVSPASGTTGEGGKLASLPTPTLEGYFFVGWYTATTGGSLVTENTVFNTNTTIIARWTHSMVTTFVDDRDNRTYKKVTIGTQTWMAENLDYNVEGSKCNENNDYYCTRYGRLYDWATAMGGSTSSSTNPSGVQGVCPAGWHLPSDAEWTQLTDYVGGWETAGTKLKPSTTDWTGWNGVSCQHSRGTDDYGFSALPGGQGYSNGNFGIPGDYGAWWSATEMVTGSYYPSYRSMHCAGEYVSMSLGSRTRTELFSVRCVAD